LIARILSTKHYNCFGQVSANPHISRHSNVAADDQISEWLDAPNHHMIDSASGDIPELLQQIPDPPTLLYVLGNKDALHLPALAIVGSRNPTRGGLQNAYEFANHLGRCGFCIVSGLAQGIDTAAHKGALDAGARTVAFLGHGIDRVYPAENRELAHRIAEQGALCSEYPLGSPPRREHFPQRNRLISGLSLGTLIVEAARRSGSLISARLAGEQGREIFAIPGSIHNPLSRGCHQLIRQGAKLVECGDDIVGELAPLVGHLVENSEISTNDSPQPVEHDADYESLLATLSYDPASADQLAEHSGLTIDQVSSMLLILELEGKIQVQAGGRYSKSQASDHKIE
jgi:DNA processing protein